MKPSCEGSGCYMGNTDEFIKWIVEILGPVLFGVKPAELLSFPMRDPHTLTKLNKIHDVFSKCHKVSFEIFEYNNTSIKVMFYHPSFLDKVLRDPRNFKFLRERGYPEEYDQKLYLRCIIEKMIEGTIPDEIGIFLGYPLKDVLGFIGHPSLKLTKVSGWRIYGNARLSDLKYEEFLNAKSKVKHLLESHSPQTVILTA